MSCARPRCPQPLPHRSSSFHHLPRCHPPVSRDNTVSRETAGSSVSALPTEIRMSLSKLEALAEEAARERRTHLAKEPDPEPLSRTLARLHTDISTLGRILTEPLPEAVPEPDKALVEGC